MASSNTTFVTFAPNTRAPFQFSPNLDGAQFQATCTWNVSGQRYYIELIDASNNPALTCAIVESGPVLQGTFAWAASVAALTTSTPHNVPIGQLVQARVYGTGSGFDGNFTMLAISANTLTYTLPDDPETGPVEGTLSFDINMASGIIVGGVQLDALLVYHAESAAFEFA